MWFYTSFYLWGRGQRLTLGRWAANGVDDGQAMKADFLKDPLGPKQNTVKSDFIVNSFCFHFRDLL